MATGRRKVRAKEGRTLSAGGNTVVVVMVVDEAIMGRLKCRQAEIINNDSLVRRQADVLGGRATALFIFFYFFFLVSSPPVFLNPYRDVGHNDGEEGGGPRTFFWRLRPYSVDIGPLFRERGGRGVE